MSKQEISKNLDELIERHDPEILAEWSKEMQIDEVDIKKQFAKVMKGIEVEGFDSEKDFWESVKWIARIDMKNIARGSTVTYIGYFLGGTYPRNWVQPKIETALTTYYQNRDEALKLGMVREAKDPESGEPIPIPKYWWEFKTGTKIKNKNWKKDLPKEEEGWMRSGYGIAIPKNELIEKYVKQKNEETGEEEEVPVFKDSTKVNWRKLKPFNLNFQSQHANPEGEKFIEIIDNECVEFLASGKISKIKILKKTDLEIYELNTSTKSEKLVRSNRLSLNIKQQISTFGRKFITPDALEKFHNLNYRSYGNSGRQYGQELFVTEGTIAELNLVDTTDEEQKDRSHMMLLEHKNLKLSQRSVTCWLPNTIKFDYGKYSQVYVIGTTSRRMVGDEWEYPQIQGVGVIPIRKVAPMDEEDEEEFESATFGSIDEDSYEPEEFSAESVEDEEFEVAEVEEAVTDEERDEF